MEKLQLCHLILMVLYWQLLQRRFGKEEKKKLIFSKGTLVRIFDTATGKKVQEVRRGTEKALIYSIAFSHDSNFIATSSDKGTIHIFGISPQKDDSNNEDKKPVNRTSKLGIFGGYFSSEWSFAWWTGPEAPSIVSFGSDNKTLIVVSSDGSFIRLSFDPVKGGECIRKAYNRYLKK